MYQLLFRTPNLLLLLYLLLLIKSMNYSLANRLFRQSLVTKYRTLNSLKCQFHKMVKHTRNLPTNCLSVFDHFSGLALKGLITHPIGYIWQNFRILDMVHWLNGRKIICRFGNVLALKIILRNKIPGNNGLFKFTSTLNKVWLPN